MRWHEIFREFEQSTDDQARSFIMDLLAPLKAQGVGSITCQQIIDQLHQDPTFDGLAIDEQFIMSALKGEPNIRIETDPNNGEMTVFLDDVSQSRQVDKKKSDQEAKHIRQAAVRQATKGE